MPPIKHATHVFISARDQTPVKINASHCCNASHPSHRRRLQVGVYYSILQASGWCILFMLSMAAVLYVALGCSLVCCSVVCCTIAAVLYVALWLRLSCTNFWRVVGECWLSCRYLSSDFLALPCPSFLLSSCPSCVPLSLSVCLFVCVWEGR